jgi:tetratricopeptide (TPR) repeat protein
VKPAVDKAAIAAARKEKAAKEAAAALQRRYLQGKAEMTRGDYEHAIVDLEAVLKEKPGYQDAASLLDQARGLRRADAQRQLSAGNAASGKGDYAGAMAAYQRAARIDPNLAGLQEGIAGVRQKMRDEGEAAYRRARQLDAVGRTQDALPLYQRAVSLLPADDPSGKAARDRLEALKGQNP